MRVASTNRTDVLASLTFNLVTIEASLAFFSLSLVEDVLCRFSCDTLNFVS